MAPERDRRGELAFKAVGFTPWPVEEGAPGERLRVAVGPVGTPEAPGLQLRSFIFEKVRHKNGCLLRCAWQAAAQRPRRAGRPHWPGRAARPRWRREPARVPQVLPPPSQLVMVKLPRPLGVVFEEDAKKGRAVVAELTPGGAAERVARAAALNVQLWACAPRPGDVLRAVTCTNIVFPYGETC